MPGSQWSVCLLETETEDEEVLRFGNDGMKAAMTYIRRGVVAQRPAELILSGGLPGLEGEVVDRYVPPPADAPSHHGRRLSVTMGEERPAIPVRDRRALEDADESPGAQRIRKLRDEMVHAAFWYATGFIDSAGGLSPFGPGGVNPHRFSDYHADRKGFHSVADSWAKWSVQRREEIGK